MSREEVLWVIQAQIVYLSMRVVDGASLTTDADKEMVEAESVGAVPPSLVLYADGLFRSSVIASLNSVAASSARAKRTAPV